MPAQGRQSRLTARSQGSNGRHDLEDFNCPQPLMNMSLAIMFSVCRTGMTKTMTGTSISPTSEPIHLLSTGGASLPDLLCSVASLRIATVYLRG